MELGANVTKNISSNVDELIDFIIETADVSDVELLVSGTELEDIYNRVKYDVSYDILRSSSLYNNEQTYGQFSNIINGEGYDTVSFFSKLPVYQQSRYADRANISFNIFVQ